MLKAKIKTAALSKSVDIFLFTKSVIFCSIKHVDKNVKKIGNITMDLDTLAKKTEQDVTKLKEYFDRVKSKSVLRQLSRK